VVRGAVSRNNITAKSLEKSCSTFRSTLLFFLLSTIVYVVCKLLQIRGHRFDSGTRLHFRKHLIFVWLVIAVYPMMVMPKIPLLVDRIISPKDQFLNLLWDW